MVIFKTFSTPKGHYFYDRNTNKIIKVSKHELEDLERFQNGISDGFNSQTIKKYQEQGYLLESNVEKIEHPSLCNVKHYMDNRVEQMILQVTQNCNLRCGYCIYSGNYTNRTHSNKKMDWDTAKAALDYLIQHSGEMKEIVVGFYGGEPLLEYELIKKCVEYIENHVEGKKVGFSITTNGTLLTIDICNYFFEHNFSVLISLDGSKNEHNKYRVFADGRGSFDTIFNNLLAIRAQNPEFIKLVRFNAVCNPENDYLSMTEFFHKDAIMAEARVALNLVDTDNSKVDINFTEEFYQARVYDYFIFLLSILGKIDEKYCSKLLKVQKVRIIERYTQMRDTLQLGKVCHHSGPCIAGSRRLFVTVEGKFYPCEKVSENSPIMNIGSLGDGPNYEKSKELLNIGALTENECKNCWALTCCSICVSMMEDSDCISVKKKLSHCPSTRNSALNDLKEICMLKELGFEFKED